MCMCMCVTWLIGSKVASYSGNQLYKKVMDSSAFYKGKYRETIRNGYFGIDDDLRRGKQLNRSRYAFFLNIINRS